MVIKAAKPKATSPPAIRGQRGARVAARSWEFKANSGPASAGEGAVIGGGVGSLGGGGGGGAGGSRACTRALADSKRWLGSRPKPRAMAASSSGANGTPKLDKGMGVSNNLRRIRLVRSAATNGGCPVSRKYATTVKE